MKIELDCPLAPRLGLVFILLLGILIIFYSFNNSFNEYYEFSTQKGLLGYYDKEVDFYTLYNEQMNITDSEYEEVKFISGDIKAEKRYLTEDYVKKFNNCSLINEQLTTNYIIYKITIDKENIIYLANKEKEEEYINKYSKKWKKANIESEAIQVTNLNLLTSQNVIDSMTEKLNKNYYVASRSGVSAKTLSAQRKVIGIKFITPATDYKITSKYGMRTLNGITKMHTGVDFGVKENSPVYASAGGTIIYSDWCGNYGNYIKIDHGNGVITAYGHNNELLYDVGDTVEQGDVIALSGSTGYSTGPHIHFEIIVDNSFQNPLNYLKN